MPDTTDQSTGRSNADRTPSKAFDPRTHLRRIVVRGRETEYLDVKWRLVWLRGDHPDAHIATELVSHDGKMAVFRAEVVLPSGGRASGYGSETAQDFQDYIEKAETKAIGRALVALGYGTQFALDYEGGEEQPDEFVDEISSARTTAPSRPPEPTRVRVVPPTFVEPETSDDDDESPPSSLRPIREESPAAVRDSFDAADYSWTEFWKWARSLGYNSRSALGELLGLNIGEMTPHEVRSQLIAYREEQGLDS
ncbi:MAG TPA: hypothetical protein VHV31_05635 [Nitrolancea sp.]|nr:hypothetical protein [Nitrolancea sp.]